MTAALESLLERVKAVTGPDREIDFDLLEGAGLSYYDYARAWYETDAIDPNKIDLKKRYWDDMPTRSIDAALALVERMLPGWTWNVGMDALDEVHATIWHGVTEVDHYAATAPLAIVSALLQALIYTGAK